MTDVISYKLETWVYLGVRVGTGKKQLHLWEDEAKEQHWFGPKNLTPGATVGCQYEFHVNHKDDGGISVPTQGDHKPVFQGRLQTDEMPELAEAALCDKTAKLELAEEAAVKKAGRDIDQLGAMTLDQVRTEMRSRGNAASRGALLAAVLGYVEN